MKLNLSSKPPPLRSSLQAIFVSSQHAHAQATAINSHLSPGTNQYGRDYAVKQEYPPVDRFYFFTKLDPKRRRACVFLEEIEPGLAPIASRLDAARCALRSSGTAC